MGKKAREKREPREKGRPEPRPGMRRRAKWIVGSLVALLVVGGVGAWLWNGARATPEPAPRFNLLASTGKVISLDEFLGKQEVVLLFYMGAG